MDVDRERSFLSRHGITRAVVLRLVVVIGMLVVVGVRFERTLIAVGIAAVFLVIVLLLGRGEE
jgi:hypothetical protein